MPTPEDESMLRGGAPATPFELPRLSDRWPLMFVAALVGIVGGTIQVVALGWYGTGLAAAIGVPLLVLLQQTGELRRSAADRRLLSHEVTALRDSAAAIAHDLRSPLVTVRSYIELVDQGSYGPLPIEARRALERAVEASAKAQALVESTLRRQRGIERGDDWTGREVAQLDAVLRDVRIGLGAQIAGSGARIEVAPLPPVLGNRQALQRVFQNLVDNAIRHSPRGGRVTLDAALEGDGPSRNLVVRVRDEGPGFSDSALRRAFEPFFTERPAGTGLGLSIVERIVHQHGAKILIGNAAGGGAVVTVRFPYAEAPEDIPEKHGAPPLASAGAAR